MGRTRLRGPEGTAGSWAAGTAGEGTGRDGTGRDGERLRSHFQQVAGGGSVSFLQLGRERWGYSKENTSASFLGGKKRKRKRKKKAIIVEILALPVLFLCPEKTFSLSVLKILSKSKCYSLCRMPAGRFQKPCSVQLPASPSACSPLIQAPALSYQHAHYTLRNTV